MSRLMEDLPSFPSGASTSHENNESNSGSTSSRKLRVTLLSSEWRSTKGGLSTINRELAIQLAKHPSVAQVSVYLPQCSEEEKQIAGCHNVTLIEAEEMPGFEPNVWLSCPPEDHAVDCVIGHGAVLGRQIQILKRIHHCKWIQVVHTAPEELGIHKSYADAISRGEKKHQAEVKLCEKADQVVAVGPKLTDAFSGYLRPCGKDRDVFNLTPGIFSEFADVTQATEERKTFSVLVIGRGDKEDFQLKGYDIAACAIAELKDEPQPYKLLFVGAPSGEEEKVKDLLLQQGIDHSQLTVRCFNESREQLARLFCEVDLALMPSRTEGFGLAALEALSAGLPVLVSRHSGLGEALKKVPFASSCVVQSEDPKDWANAIKAVRGKDRKLRLREAEVLRGGYAEMYSWQDHCNRLVARMLAISQGPTADEQNLSRQTAVVCQDENPSPSEKRLHKVDPHLQRRTHCDYQEKCRRFKSSLKLSDVFFDPKYDRCFCTECHAARGDKLYYTRREPAKDYGIPIGWCRFGLKVHHRALALDVFNKWHVAFHGTRVDSVKAILECGDLVIPGDVALGGRKLSEKEGHFNDNRKPSGFYTKEIFVSPSIRYSGLNCYAKPKSFEDPPTKKKVNAKTVLQLCINPDSYQVGPQTIGATSEIDPKFSNQEIEWSTKQRGSIILCGLLVKLDETN